MARVAAYSTTLYTNQEEAVVPWELTAQLVVQQQGDEEIAKWRHCF